MKSRLTIPTALLVSAASTLAVGCNNNNTTADTGALTLPGAPECPSADAGFTLSSCHVANGTDCYVFLVSLASGDTEQVTACGDGGMCLSVNAADGGQHFQECALPGTCSASATRRIFPDGAVVDRVFC